MLNAMEKAVLLGLCDEFVTETNKEDFNFFPRTGWAQTSTSNAARETGLSLPQVKGYLSKLQEKGFIQLDHQRDPWGNLEHYVTLLPPCKEVIRYAGGYKWELI